jgi:hypothetical protein
MDREPVEAVGRDDVHRGPGFAATAVAIVTYAVAMAYVEAAVVVYLRAAYGLAVGDIFPLHEPVGADPFATIEVGREAATLVMIGAVGWLVGRTGLERLAWAAVIFGIWDIGYYAGLSVMSGWPPSLGTWDLLFLIPVPWIGPVWAPIVVSAALVVTGLAAAARLRRAERFRIGTWQVAGGLSGGLLVVLSFTIDAARILDGDSPESFAWPLFLAGMIAAVTSAATALLRPYAASSGSSGRSVNE